MSDFSSFTPTYRSSSLNLCTGSVAGTAVVTNTDSGPEKMKVICLLLTLTYIQTSYAVKIRNCGLFWTVTVDSGSRYQVTSEILGSNSIVLRINFKGKYQKLFGEMTYRFVAKTSHGDIRFEIEDKNKIITLGHRHKPQYCLPPY